jgi:hypothetical protein
MAFLSSKISTFSLNITMVGTGDTGVVSWGRPVLAYFASEPSGELAKQRVFSMNSCVSNCRSAHFGWLLKYF